MCQIFFNQKTGYEIERIDEYLLPKSFACLKPLEMSSSQRSETSELYTEWKSLAQ